MTAVARASLSKDRPRRLSLRVGLLVAILGAASLHFGLALDWGIPREELIDILFGSRDQLGAVSDLLAASKDAVAYPPGGSPDLWWSPRLSTNGHAIPAHVLLQTRGYLLKSRTFDESKTLAALASLNPRRFDPQILIYGGAYLASVAAVLFAGERLGLVRLVEDKTYYFEHPEEMGKLYTLARLVSAVAATCIVISCFWIASRFSLIAGVLAAGLLLSSPEMLAASHLAKPHALAALLGLAAIGMATADTDRPGLTGVLGGAAAGASLVYAILPAALVVLQIMRRQWRSALLIGLLAVSVFGLTNLQVFIFPDRLVDTLRNHATDYGYGHFSVVNAVHFVSDLAGNGIGPAGLLLCLVGVLICPSVFRAGAWLFLYVLVAFACTLGVLRISLLVVPLAALFAGIGAGWLWQASPRLRWRVVGLLALITLQIVPTERTLALAHAFTLGANPDRATAGQAGRWINGHIPPGATVAIEDSPQWTDDVPPFRFLQYGLTPAVEDAEYAIVSAKCPRELAEKVNEIEGHGYVEVKRFSSCVETSLGQVCNCSYPVNLDVAVLKRTGAGQTRSRTHTVGATPSVPAVTAGLT